MTAVFDLSARRTGLASTAFGHPNARLLAADALDMTVGYGEGINCIQLKAEFMLPLSEQCIGVGKLGAREKSLIDRCVAAVYHDYIQGGYRGESPTLRDFHNELLRQPETEAKSVALAMELFTTGSLSIFAHQTNVDIATA